MLIGHSVSKAKNPWKMADTDFTSVYRQFFEEFGRTVKPQDPLPIGVPDYSVALCEMTGEVIELSIQYLTLM